MTSSIPNMIFHVPFVLDPAAKSASGIRPMSMRRAFESIGFNVLEVSGHHADRRKQMLELRSQIRDGMKIEFVYSEASTAPTGLREPVTFATSLTRDITFLKWCRRRGIPVGLFYRDIYWQFDGFASQSSKMMVAFLRWRYRSDLRGYRAAVDKLYLPSRQMAEYLPFANRAQASALPPGSPSVESGAPKGELSLLYVGGLGKYYRLHETVRGVAMAKQARLTICTRANEWSTEQSSYAGLVDGSTAVVHQFGPELERLYDDAHIGVLLMEPIKYREFAAPMKLYEYLGRGKPIIATRGSLAAEIVEENQIGWTIPYEAEALRELLDHLFLHPGELESAQRNARSVRTEHTWAARAAQVAAELKECSAVGTNL